MKRQYEISEGMGSLKTASESIGRSRSGGSLLMFGLLLCGGLGSFTGCANSGASLRGAGGGWTPVDHARAQLEWIQNSSRNLTAEELFHARNTPWSGRRLTPAERERWIRNQLMTIPDADRDSVASGRRVLDRPQAMDAAIERWQRESETSRNE